MAEEIESTESVVQGVAEAAESIVQATEDAKNEAKKEFPRNLDFLLDVQLQVSVQVGATRMSIQDLLQLGQGSVIELSKLAGEPLDVYVNERLIARGEAVIVNEKFGVRITDIVSQHDRIETLA